MPETRSPARRARGSSSPTSGRSPRATASTGSTGGRARVCRRLQVNESHPERNADVVLFLDTFAEARSDDGGTLDRTIRAAAALAHGYLTRRDRVGVVGFGGVVRWLAPSTGRIQLHRIVETLIETEIAFSYAWKRIDLLPPRTLPPQSLVLALSPLLDGRVLDALTDLRARGFDLAIVDVSPFSAVEAAADRGRSAGVPALATLARDAARPLPAARRPGRRVARRGGHRGRAGGGEVVQASRSNPARLIAAVAAVVARGRARRLPAPALRGA